MTDPFEKRIRRAEQLEKEWPFAAELLTFFRDVYRFQASLFRELERVAYPAVRVTDGFQHLPTLLDLAARIGPASLREQVPRLKEFGPECWARFSITFHNRTWFEEPARPEDFFIRVAEEPYRLLTRGNAASVVKEGNAQRSCLVCGGPPSVSLLREDKIADTVRRSLICALCSHEWDFARVVCPNCGEEKTEKLPRYTAQ